MCFRGGEETSVQFDPRANQSIVSPGHISRVIAGDYKQFIGGVSNLTVAGAFAGLPLVKDRSSSYNVKTVLGNTNFTTVAGAYISTSGVATTIAAGGAFTATATGVASMIAGGNANVTSGAAATMTAAGAATMTAGGAATVTGGGITSINAGAALAITGVGDVSITGANVRLTGALIYLN